jgi:hypothetical protein
MSNTNSTTASKIITDLKVLGEQIKTASKAHKRVDVQWQVLALSAIAAFASHGNVFYVNEVYKNLGKGARHVAMTAYFTGFGGVKANEGENKETTPFVKDHDKQADLKGAAETMWFDMKPSAKPDQEIDYLALALKVIKRSPKDGQGTKHAELRMALSECVQQYADATGETIDGLPTFGDAEGEGETADELAGVSTAS